MDKLQQCGQSHLRRCVSELYATILQYDIIQTFTTST